MPAVMRAISVKDASAWSGEPVDRVVLDYDGRHRRRMAMKGARDSPFYSTCRPPRDYAAGMRWCCKTAGW